MKYRIFLFAIGLFFTGLFFAFTFLVRTDALRPFDFNMTVRIQDNIPEKAYRYLELISQFPRFEIMTGLIILLLVTFRQWWQMIVILGLYAGAHALELVGKMILSQPPPPFMFYKLQNPNNVWFPENYVIEGNSYPSGHSLRAFFFAVLVSYFIVSSKKLPPIIKLIVISGIGFLASLVALGKVAMGQHWTTDVIAGGFLGFGMALVSVSMMNFSFRKKRLSS